MSTGMDTETTTLKSIYDGDQADTRELDKKPKGGILGWVRAVPS